MNLFNKYLTYMSGEFKERLEHDDVSKESQFCTRCCFKFYVKFRNFRWEFIAFMISTLYESTRCIDLRSEPFAGYEGRTSDTLNFNGDCMGRGQSPPEKFCDFRCLYADFLSKIID